MAFSTASSGMRSRTDCRIVLPVRNSSVKSTAPTMAFTIAPTSPSCRSCACAYSASFWVSVSSGEFANSASIVAHICADRSRIVDAHDERKHPPLVEQSRLVEVGVVDDDAVRLRGRAGHVIGTDDLEVPVGAAILLDDRRAQRHPIADLPAVRLHQQLADERAGARCRPWPGAGRATTCQSG